MAEITRERTGQLLRGVFQILLDHPNGLPAKQVLERLESVVPPTEFENTSYPRNPSFRRYEKIVRFHTINFVKAGWLVKDKGQWSVTEEGRRAYGHFSAPGDFAREASRLYREWKKDQPDDVSVVDDDTSVATATLEEADEAAWAEIQGHLTEMDPYDFQSLVAGLLRAMGYHVSWQAPPGPDGGTDIIAHTDPLGVRGPRIRVQVKRRQDRLSVEAVRSFIAVLGEADIGLFVSVGGFTKDAENEVRGQERRRIMLLDLKRLFDLWVEHYARIPDNARRLLPLRPVYYLDLTA